VVDGITAYQMAWAAFCLAPSRDDLPHLRLEIFVEVKSPPGRRAPWQVQSIEVGSGDSVPAGPEEADRPFPSEAREKLERMGLSVEGGGYWGVRVWAEGEVAEHVVQDEEVAGEILETVLGAACKMARVEEPLD
jgi:hypothetical protein